MKAGDEETRWRVVMCSVSGGCPWLLLFTPDGDVEFS